MVQNRYRITNQPGLLVSTTPLRLQLLAGCLTHQLTELLAALGEQSKPIAFGQNPMGFWG